MFTVSQAKQRASQSRWQALKHHLQHGDVLFRALTALGALTVFMLIVIIGYELWLNSPLPREKFGWRFLVEIEWNPVTQEFGAFPFIFGTLQTSVMALIFAVPVSLGIAIFLAELAPAWLRQPLGFIVELLAAVPSVVYGLWGLFVFIPAFARPVAELLHTTLGFLPLFTGPVYGPSLLSASLILAIMILPTISAVSRDVLLAIPASQREAALALGATRWETIWRVLLPYGLSGILGAIILGLGRALGETMAVTMVIGNNLDLTLSLLHPGYTMASIIANEFAEATYELYIQSLIQIALVLFVLTLVLNSIARVLVWRVARRVPTEVRI
jgi:phosphate transport system permease protein